MFSLEILKESYIKFKNDLDSVINNSPIFVNNILFKVAFIVFFNIYFIIKIIFLTVLVLGALFLSLFVDRKEKSIRRKIRKKYENKEQQFIVLVKNKNWNSFYQNQLIKSIDDSIIVFWLNDESNNDEKNDIVEFTKTLNSNISYPIYLSFKNKEYLYQNLRNNLFRYKKGKMSYDELIEFINGLKYNEHYH